MGYLNEDGLATLVGKVKGQVVQLTSAEYRNLPASKNSDNKTYFVTDEDYAYAIDDEPTLNSDNLVKSGGVYTYTSKIGSGTLTTTAQTIIPAINELDAAIDTIKNGLTKTALADQDGTVTTSSTGTANISSIVPNRTIPVFARATNVSAFITIMYNINNTYWIRAVDWDGAPVANTSLNLKVVGIKTDAIKDW